MTERRGNIEATAEHGGAQREYARRVAERQRATALIPQEASSGSGLLWASTAVANLYPPITFQPSLLPESFRPRGDASYDHGRPRQNTGEYTRARVYSDFSVSSKVMFTAIRIIDEWNLVSYHKDDVSIPGYFPQEPVAAHGVPLQKARRHNGGKEFNPWRHKHCGPRRLTCALRVTFPRRARSRLAA